MAQDLAVEGLAAANEGMTVRDDVRARVRQDEPEAPYRQRRMVAWFHPLRIARTAVRVLLAGVFARFVDRREAQAALPRVVVDEDDAEAADTGAAKASGRLALDADLSTRSEVWIDYVADIGDGWDAAYTTAMSVGRKTLVVDGLVDELPRADLLVFGGDNVYPTPSHDEYRDRLKRPYEAAFPDESDGHDGKRPWLFAIPGNHDWYDGLTSFLRLFCQGRRIGGWRTRQTRSYFAVRLPARWMIWGTDIQLDTEIDVVQLDHFRRLAKDFAESRIILCTAKPAWIRELQRDAGSYKNYWFFIDQICKAGSTCCVSIAGDLHHYMRYATPSGEIQKITAGGGGSYLRGTHDIPELVVPPDPDKVAFYSTEGKAETCRESGFAFPSRIESRRLALGALKFPLLRQNWGFCLFLGVMCLMFAWTIGLLNPNPVRSDFQQAITTAQELRPGFASIADYGARLISAVVSRPAPGALPFIVLLLFGAYCRVANPGSRKLFTWSWGILHGALHVSLAVLAVHMIARLAASRFGPDVSGWASWELLSVYAGIIATGSAGGGILMGLYLVLSDRFFHLHTTEVFSAQALPDYRCFLRMQIKESGELTIYPIGIRRAPRRWQRKLDRIKGEALFTPSQDMPRLHLIEGPITVPLPSVSSSGQR